MSKTVAKLFGAAVYKNAVIWILRVRKQIGEQKYDHSDRPVFDPLRDLP
jgi:hypothetical protein